MYCVCVSCLAWWQYNWYADEWVGESAERPVSFFDVGDSGGECGVPTATHVPLPLWWSADIGAIHIIAMCTEVNGQSKN